MQLSLGITGRYHRSSATSPSSHLKDRASRLSRSTSPTRDARKSSVRVTSASDSMQLPGGKVTSEGLSALLSSQPRSRQGMQLDPSKPSVQILQKRARSRAKGLGIPQGDRRLVLEDDKTSLLHRYGLRLDGEDEVRSARQGDLQALEPAARERSYSYHRGGWPGQ